MNCAWCSPSKNGTDGICDACMLRYFGVDPLTIHAEIAAQEREQTKPIIAEQQKYHKPNIVNIKTGSTGPLPRPRLTHPLPDPYNWTASPHFQ